MRDTWMVCQCHLVNGTLKYRGWARAPARSSERARWLGGGSRVARQQAAAAQSFSGRPREQSQRTHARLIMPRYERTGALAWVRRWWRALLAELCATALLVALGVASTLAAPGEPPPPLGDVAAAFGFVVVGCCVAFGAASGAHMNPAVSLSAALCGRLAPALALAYALAQLAGAVLGFAALQAALLPLAGAASNSTLAASNSTLAASNSTLAGLTLPARHVGAWSAVALEAALTGLLALACCGAWAAHDPAAPDHAAPLKLGVLVAGLVYAGGRMSGASLNPARSFAPALLQNHWEYHWVYWAGPLGGAALAALLHLALTPPRGARRGGEGGAAREGLALQDKA